MSFSGCGTQSEWLHGSPTASTAPTVAPAIMAALSLPLMATGAGGGVEGLGVGAGSEERGGGDGCGEGGAGDGCGEEGAGGGCREGEALGMTGPGGAGGGGSRKAPRIVTG